MRDDSCERCGAPVASEEGFCTQCVGWLKEPRELSEQQVVEAVQFGTAAVTSSDRIVMCMGSVVLPLAIALFSFTYLTLDVYDSSQRAYPSNPSVPVGPVFVVWSMTLPAHEIYFHRMSSMPFSLAGTLRTVVILQVITVLILLGAVYLAQMRRRQVDTARTRLAGLVQR